jgi:hypothetical protein
VVDNSHFNRHLPRPLSGEATIIHHGQTTQQSNQTQTAEGLPQAQAGHRQEIITPHGQGKRSPVATDFYKNEPYI